MTIPKQSTVITAQTAGTAGTACPPNRIKGASDSPIAASLEWGADIISASTTSPVADFLNGINKCPMEPVSINSLGLGLSPRAAGINADHVERLIEAEGPFKPILVHGQTLHIIDGAHRVAAARRRGMTTIDAFLFDGPIELAFILAVHANVKHGLPLTLKDRRAAARTILATHNEWSNRMIAATTGLSAGTVDKLRCAAENKQQLSSRIGADGRRRPISTGASRRRAAEMFKERPEASLREVARAVGLSPATVLDVRNRLNRGEASPPEPTSPTTPARSESDPAISPRRQGDTTVLNLHRLREVDALLSMLARDPSMRMSQSGRELLRWLHQRSVRPADTARIAEAIIPDHCVTHVVDLARRYSAQWAQLAEKLLVQDRHASLEPADELMHRSSG